MCMCVCACTYVLRNIPPAQGASTAALARRLAPGAQQHPLALPLPLRRALRLRLRPQHARQRRWGRGGGRQEAAAAAALDEDAASGGGWHRLGGWMCLGPVLCVECRGQRKVDHKVDPWATDECKQTPPLVLLYAKQGQSIDPTELPWLCLRNAPGRRACVRVPIPKKGKAVTCITSATEQNTESVGGCRPACLNRHARRGATQARRIDGARPSKAIQSKRLGMN